MLLRTLEKLHLERHEIPSLPAEISQLRALKFLELRHNSIKYLHTGLKRLTLLKVVDFHDNQISSLPDGMGALVCLEILKVGRALLVPTFHWNSFSELYLISSFLLLRFF